MPDLGYHYEPLDYLANHVALSASLYLESGVAVGVMGVNGGFNMLANGNLESTGTASTMNHLCHWANVQEQDGSFDGNPLFQMTSSSAYPKLTFRFTDVSPLPGLLGDLVSYGGSSGPYQEISFRDCQLQCVNFNSTYYSAPQPAVLALTNNLLDRCKFYVLHHPSYTGTTDQRFYAYNNLWHNSFLSLLYYNTGANSYWRIYDNLFDKTTQVRGVDSYGSSYVQYAYNGFTSGTVRVLAGASDKFNLIADFQVGPLGQFYYPPSGGIHSLANLINHGSRSASAAGLDSPNSYTVVANQTLDGWTGSGGNGDPVDIGFHYPLSDPPTAYCQDAMTGEEYPGHIYPKRFYCRLWWHADIRRGPGSGPNKRHIECDYAK